ncbi:MAG: hypothetical protein J6N32_04285 [Clostridia bacterium]|nr:hypothetical protein [Clostridia bacterium]
MKSDHIEQKNTGLGMTVLLMLILALFGRGVSYVNTAAATDISYAAWVPAALSYLGELIVCARMVLGIAGITFAMYFFGKPTALRFLAGTAGAALADYAARFGIDLATKAIAEMEFLAASWLFMQFLYEMLFVVLSCVVAGAMKAKMERTEVRRQAEKYTVNRACTVSLLLVMLSRLALELWYIVDFLLAYTNITAAETAAMVGTVLKVIVIYGGAAVLLGEWYTELLKKRCGGLQNVKNA